MSVRVVSATFRVVTPLFLGGAEPAKDCEEEELFGSRVESNRPDRRIGARARSSFIWTRSEPTATPWPFSPSFPLLGTAPDTAIAGRLGCPAYEVAQRRRKLGIIDSPGGPARRPATAGGRS